jgi:hypothetical protein
VDIGLNRLERACQECGAELLNPIITKPATKSTKSTELINEADRFGGSLTGRAFFVLFVPFCGFLDTVSARTL